MNRKIKKQIMDIFDTFEEAFNYIEANESVEMGIVLLENIRDSITETYKVIKKETNLGRDVVSMINVFKQSVGDIINRNRYTIEEIQDLKDQLTGLTNGFYEMIKNDKIKMVFLPYKEDMWDSLESIYLAASKDEECEAYCVPIPYYTKKTDGTYSKLCYEGEKYPSNIKIMNWEKFNIEEIDPDVIFIHNPYDNANKVTSVVPEFYAKQLKKTRALLVYVPYFVASRISDDLCVNNATLYADKIVVLNEGEREIYKRNINEFLSLNNLKINQEYLHNKFLILGSPKFDKVISGKKEDYVLPEDWKSIIDSREGENKKIVFYNTTVSEIIQFGSQFIDKLKSVLQVFKSRKDIVLWWRPHPLSLSTFESMKPELAEEYKQIVNKYKNEEWGIFDETSNFHRAIAWCDAYYGFGGSSVTLLFGSTLKPVMVSHRCDIESKKIADSSFNEKISFFSNRLHEYLENGLLNYNEKNNLCGLFWDDSGEQDLFNYLDYIVEKKEDNTSKKWLLLIKEGYRQLGISQKENVGKKVVDYLKNELKEF